MVASIINWSEPDSADAVLISVPYGHGASFGAGASRGPAAIIACLDRQIELLERHTGTEPALDYKIAHQLLAEVEALPPEVMVEQVAAAVARAAPRFTVLLGGTHAVSIGAFRAHAARGRVDDVTIVQLDAHLDMRDDDADYNDRDPSRFAHSCVMRRGRELGFRTCSVGIRAYAREEHRFAVAEGLPVFEWGLDAEPAIETILAAVATERIYLTIDVDGFDPAVAPATGTPVPGGLSWAYGTRLLRALCSAKEVIGADVVEVAPVPGSGLTEYAAAQLCYDILCYTLLKRDGKLAFL
jgi:N1-aminopropylagmatine ureohydrolase